MKQDPPQKDHQQEIYLKMSPAQKWEQVCKLRELAWALKTAALREKHPDWSDKQIANEVRKIFLYAAT